MMSPLRTPYRGGRGRGGFTLVEVACSMIILALMLTGFMASFRLLGDKIVKRDLERRALAVAERQLEALLASREEPDPGDRQGTDEMDPEFTWEMELKRVSVGDEQPRLDLKNTVIEVTVTVRPAGFSFTDFDSIKLTRRVVELKPLPGQAVAVPLTRELEEPDWYIELRRKLGREPTAEETFQALLENLGVSEESLEYEGQDAADEDAEEAP